MLSHITINQQDKHSFSDLENLFLSNALVFIHGFKRQHILEIKYNGKK